MCNCAGWIVRSAAGHDAGLLFCVVGAEEDGRLLLANGKQRKLSAPKRKKHSHIVVEDRGSFVHPAIQKLQHRELVTDRELRRALAAFKGR